MTFYRILLLYGWVLAIVCLLTGTPFENPVVLLVFCILFLAEFKPWRAFTP